MVIGLFTSLMLFFSSAYAENTTQGQIQVFQDADGNWVYAPAGAQSRQSRPGGTGSPSASSGAGVQTRNYYGPASSMSSRTQAINDRGGEALNQRCGGPLEIVSQNMRCNELAFDADFLKTVQTEGMACAQQASRDAYNFTPDKVKLVTGEGQVSFGRMVEGSGKVSLHALGRALDIFSVELSKGPALMTPRMNGGEDKNFYASFRVCWEGVVRKAQGMGIAGSGGDGTVEYLDSRVHNHLHISLPALDDIRSRHGVAGS